MGKVRIEWLTEDGRHIYVKTSLRSSFQGNMFFEAEGPFELTHVFVIKDDGDIIAKPKGSKRGAWVTVGQVRESFSGTTYWIGPVDKLCIVEQRDLDYPMAQQWKREHEALKAGTAGAPEGSN
uniref:Uncharacterized protein n=1 Tax=viral metagenome TaxID=1070528 RepID=A0A6M3LXU4_9ZZZZ